MWAHMKKRWQTATLMSMGNIDQRWAVSKLDEILLGLSDGRLVENVARSRHSLWFSLLEEAYGG